jgi:Putative ATPase subunit of terminase (gpP-like)
MQSQSKPPVDREAVRVLAIELGAREAARRLGLNPNTVLSWSKRYNWELPNRRGGATKASANAITLQSKPGDVLLATHKELEQATKSSMARATARAAREAEQLEQVLPRSQQLQQLAAAAAKVFGWNEGGTTIHADKALVVTTEQLQRMRELCDADEQPAVIEADAITTEE